jgi:hypothetical protein
MRWNPFSGLDAYAVMVALSIWIGYSFSVGIPTYVDHRIGLSESQFPLEYWILVPGPFLALFIYKIIISEKYDYLKKSIITLISINFVSWFALLNFGFPHTHVLTYSMSIGLVLAISVYIHYFELEPYLNYVYDKSISEIVKVEKIKLDYDLWKNIFLTSLSTYAVVSIGSLAFFAQLTKIVSDDIENQHLLMNALGMDVSLVSLIFLILVCSEFIKKLSAIKEKLSEIKKEPQVPAVVPPAPGLNR